MKPKTLLFCSAALLFLACNSETKTGESEVPMADSTSSKEQTYTAPDSATMMKNWQEYMTPGDVHKMMASWDGTWNGEITMWHAPGAPPELSKGTSTNKMIMGGRYQVSNYSANMMDMPFEGMSTLAYDNAKKTFISTWIDNMGTGIMTLEGNWDDAHKSMTLKGKLVDPVAGTGKEMDIREVLKVVDDNNQVMEMYSAGPDGKEFKSMEIKYTRKK